MKRVRKTFDTKFGESPSSLNAFDSKSSYETANLIVIPVPWDLTCSYGRGAARGPELIRQASLQLDFFNTEFKCSYQDQIYFEKNPPHIQSLNRKSTKWADEVQALWAKGNKLSGESEKRLCEKVNQACEKMLDWLYKKSSLLLQEGKIPALAGGDHSASEALLGALGEKFEGKYGILHIDAHSDLRPRYQGFSYSHGSVMHRVLNSPRAPEKLVQVGVRDICEEEYHSIKTDPRICCFFDRELSTRLFNGSPWGEICHQIISHLPSKVYISLDVDGLSWENGPGTGTPVPGGLSFAQTLYLLSEIKRQKKKVLGFDVMECAPGEEAGRLSRAGFDANEKCAPGKDSGKTEGFEQKSEAKEKRTKERTGNETGDQTGQRISAALSSPQRESSISRWNGNVAARLIYDMAGLALFSQGLL